MKKLKEVYRLKFECGYSHRVIGNSLNISAGTVFEYLALFKAAKLSWPDVASLDEQILESLVYCTSSNHSKAKRVKPDYAHIHAELKRKGVTQLLLWREFKEKHPEGVGYTQFCRDYQEFSRTLEPVMRLKHKAGEKVFVDYSGVKMEWLDPKTGEIHSVEIFVGCLGASDLIYAEATPSQSLPNWMASHVRMFEAFGGVPEMVVPDNLKSGVRKAHRYDPDLNQNYSLLAEHYGVAVVPTRIVSPRDKAKVENAVLCVEREVIAPLRHQTFTSLCEVNQAIQEQLQKLNQRPMQRLGISRQEQFEQLEKKTLKSLPLYPLTWEEWKKSKVQKDYHICVNKHFYSVPYSYIGKIVDACLTSHQLLIFHEAQQIAIHLRAPSDYQFTTLEAHMPQQHVHYLQNEEDAAVTPLLEWAKTMGDKVFECIQHFFQTRTFPQQGIRVVQGLKQLAESFGAERFEKACQKTLELGSFRFETLEQILKHQLDKSSDSTDITTVPITAPQYFRGSAYFQ